MGNKILTKKGFTFVELLVSVGIVAIVGTVVYTALVNGINVWRRANADRNYNQDIRLFTEKMSRDLRNTFQFSNISFEGTEDSVKFPALVLSVPDSVEDESRGYYSVGRVNYFYDKDQNALCKAEQDYAQVCQEQTNQFQESEQESEEENSLSQILIGHLQAMEIGYCYLDNASGDFKWKQDWKRQEQDSIPQAIKIKLVFERELNRQDLERVIFIPLGSGEQKIDLGPLTVNP